MILGDKTATQLLLFPLGRAPIAPENVLCATGLQRFIKGDSYPVAQLFLILWIMDPFEDLMKAYIGHSTEVYNMLFHNIMIPIYGSYRW